jgi:hypothetical protein
MAEELHTNGHDGNGHVERAPKGVTLSAADGAIVDALLGRETSTVSDPARETRVQDWLKVLGSAPAPEPSGDLLARTLAAVESDHMKLPAAGGPAQAAPEEADDVDVMPAVRRRWSRRLAELGAMAVAASILVVVISVGLKQTAPSRARIACAHNLTKVAAGFETYSSAFSGQLPVLAMPANRNWMQCNEPGSAKSNASNLLAMVNAGYVTPENLLCAGVTSKTKGPDGSMIDYSYVHVYNDPPLKPTWGKASPHVVLTDKNPLFVDQVPVKVSEAQTNKNSPNHDGKGNYVMRSDGSISWEITPNVGPMADNLWTVSEGGQRLLSYTGTEAPSVSSDVFVCP